MKILIVDDSELGRKCIKQELAADEFEFIEAKSGEAALEIAASTRIDLVTLDIEMPDLSGFEVCNNIRTSVAIPAYNHMVPIVFVTGNDSLEERKNSFQNGASEFIGKKFKQGELLTTVNRLLFPEKKFENLTIMVVDDSLVARAHASLAFKRFGVSIIEAVDGMQAFNILQEKNQRIDLVITDQEMPVLSGMELCRKIRHELGLKKLPVIFLTGESRPQGILDIFKAGATDYLSKPYIAEELLARIGVRLEACNLQDRLDENITELIELHKQKDTFLTACTHDFKTPLNTIMGYSSLLLQSHTLAENVCEDLRRIYSAGELTLQMVQNIIDLTQFRQGDETNYTEVSIYQILNNSIKMNAPAARQKSIKLDCHFKLDRSLKIRGDSVELTRLFNNVISNAIKFTDSGGLVSLNTNSKNTAELVITIRDTGIGIPENKIAQLLSNHKNDSRRGTVGEKGSGMGLAISSEIIKRHNGQIDVESEVDVGSTFSIRLPVIAN